MRDLLRLSPNTERVPFNYQRSLVGAFHKWLGLNEVHDELSLYSLSWLSPGDRHADGLDFPWGSTFFISAARPELLSRLINGILKGHHIRWGMRVEEIDIQEAGEFGERQRFRVQSPVFIRRKVDGNHKFYLYSDPEANQLMTETLQKKLRKLGLPTDVAVRFDRSYPKPRVRKITFDKVELKASACPVILEGDPRAIQAAWKVGIGNSTGIGFGALNN